MCSVHLVNPRAMLFAPWGRFVRKGRKVSLRFALGVMEEGFLRRRFSRMLKAFLIKDGAGVRRLMNSACHMTHCARQSTTVVYENQIARHARKRARLPNPHG